MVSLDGRPGRLDATFRPDDSFTVNLTGPAGWLSSRAFTATLGGVALSVSENGDVLTVVASAAITLAATSPAQFVLTLTGGNDALVGTWSARTDGSAQTSTTAAVIIDSLDVAVTLTDATTAADLAAHIADTADAHDASAISILDTAGDFTATDVEGALAELQSDAETDAAALATFIDTTAPGTYARPIPVGPGDYLAPVGATRSSTAVNAGKIYYFPQFIPAGNWDKIGVNVTSGVAGSINLGIYADDNGAPGAKETDLTGALLSSASIAGVEGAIDYDSLGAWKWLAFRCDVGASLSFITSGGSPVGRLALTDGLGYVYRETVSAGTALPSTATPTEITTAFPDIVLRRSPS